MTTLRSSTTLISSMAAALLLAGGCGTELASTFDPDEEDPDKEELEPGIPEEDGPLPGTPGEDEEDEGESEDDGEDDGADDGVGAEEGGEEPDNDDLEDEEPEPKPVCGNGVLEQDEQCDDGNEDQGDGCLADCVTPDSCLVIKQHDDEAQDGFYVVEPAGLDPFEVWCDMSTDGGGYTFLKIDAGEPLSAPQAEAACAALSMRLLIPRTQPHLYSAYWVAMNLQIGQSAGKEYLHMLGIYPAWQGASCAWAQLNSETPACQWEAGDQGPFWVSDRIDIGEPNGTGSLDGSMAYELDAGGHVESYAEVAGGGAESSRFICDFGDKK
jgi:cysteine-rich repeat protein